MGEIYRKEGEEKKRMYTESDFSWMFNREFLWRMFKYRIFQARYYLDKIWFPIYEFIVSLLYLALRVIRGGIRRAKKQIKFW